MKYNFTDIALSEDGDLILDPDNDIAIVNSIDAFAQEIEFRLKTDKRDMFLHSEFGNELKEQIGQRNTREVAERGRADIISCLTYGGLIDPLDLLVVAIPVDSNTLMYHIEVRNNNYTAYKTDLICDLENGIRRRA